MTDTTADRRVGVGVVPLGVGWLVVALVGWGVFYATGGARDGAELVGDRAVSWAAGLAVAVALGLALLVLVERRWPLSPAVALAVLAAAGWGIANAVGWSIDVQAGGPASGLVTGAVLVAAGQDRPPRLRLLACVLAGVVGLVAGRLASGPGHGPVQVAVPLVLGLVAAGLAWATLGVRLPWWPVAALTAGWGLAWVGAYLLTQQLLAGRPAALVIGAEIVGAAAVGGALTGWAWRRRSGESVAVVTARWALAASAGVGLGAGLAIALYALWPVPGQFSGPLELLEVGTTVGLGMGAAVALLPTLRRLGRPGRPA